MKKKQIKNKGFKVHYKLSTDTISDDKNVHSVKSYINYHHFFHQILKGKLSFKLYKSFNISIKVKEW